MASVSVSHTPIGIGGTSASDFLRSSTNGISGIPLKALGRVKLGLKRRDFTVASKLRKKVKKHDHPWPDNPDPNVKDVVLTHLSSFKPLKEKPKPVTLDFERPLVEIEKKINDVRKMAKKTGLDFSDQIFSLENKYQQALKYLYSHLTPIQRVNIARHPNRPTFLDYVYNITEKFVELHGDRAGYDDPAIVTGIGTIDGRRYMFMGHQKGRNTKENIKRNFGMPTPHGYRKALRMMYYADHHGFPIITFIDTPGAYADLKSEELGQGEAIAHNLRTMFGLKVPVISIVIGEGGSGGALAIGCANKLLMLENAVFYVASPEACAAILWKSAKASPKAAKKLKITAAELCKLQVADSVIPEPLGGAHTDPSWTSQQIKFAINEAMDELEAMETEDLLRHRMLKFRKIGGFQEGIRIDPKRSFNMKKRELPAKKISDSELKSKVGKPKQQILNVKESSIKPQESDLNVMIQKLKAEVDKEYFKAVKAIGLIDRLVKLREEFSKANSEDQLIHPALKDKIEKLHKEINQRLSAAPNYGKLQDKLDMLKELSKVKFQTEKNKHAVSLKQEFEAKFEDVINNPGIKKKYEALKAEIAASGQALPSNLDDELRNKIIEFKKELELELSDAVKAAGLDVDIVIPKVPNHAKETVSEIKSNQAELNKEIYGEIETALNSSDLQSLMELLKIEVAKAGKMPDLKSKNRIAALEQQIKLSLEEAIGASSLKQKYENLKSEISSNDESSRDLDGSLNKEAESRVEVGINCTLV